MTPTDHHVTIGQIVSTPYMTTAQEMSLIKFNINWVKTVAEALRIFEENDPILTIRLPLTKFCEHVKLV